MNIHYKNYPTDYIDCLQGQGKRHKARCFWEYQNDVQIREVNSIGFYAKSWGQEKPMSKGSVHKWVKEFKLELQKYYDALSLMNSQHHRSVVKQSERQVNGKGTNEQPQSTTVPMIEEIEETASERQVNKALIINNNIRREYDSFYFLYRQFNVYAGSKEEAKQSFVNVDDVAHSRLSVASMFYIKDMSVSRHVGVKKFLDNKIYLNYMEIHLRVYFKGEWVSGVYDSNTEIFKSDGVEYGLKATKLADKFSKNEVEFMREAA